VLDEEYKQWTKKQRRLVLAFLILNGVVTVLFGAGLVVFFLSVRGSCGFYRDIAVAPVNAKASQLGIQIVVDSRNSFSTLHCSGTLPPPSYSLLQLAHHYGIPVPH
jgi:hypothetical protein